MVNKLKQYEDTSAWSYHVDKEFYADLDRFNQVLRQDWAGADVETHREAEAFLNREAWLIDEARFNEWLELFSADCLYWVPVIPGGGDPRTQISHAFDDCRRLTDRVYWLRTGLAFSQIPQSRTRRIISNIEVHDEPDNSLRFIRSNFMVHEFRAGVAKVYAGWTGHVLSEGENGWEIRLKQANLIDSEQIHENLTLIF